MVKDQVQGGFAPEVLGVLEEAHAVIENDHFVYVTGDHGSGWIDKDAIYPHTERVERLCRDMAREVRGWGAEAVRRAGGEVVGAACLVTRGNVGAEGLGANRFVYLLEYKIPSWPASSCQLCRAGVPINTRFAHGREYLARLAQKP
jgi:hypothetical protein